MPFDACRPILIAVSHSAPENSRHAPPRRWAGLAGRAHGDERGSGTPLVFLHGLTFDCRMWDPVLDALPSTHRAIALDLPGHGNSAALPQHGHAAVAEAIHEAVLDLGLDTPIVVGHSNGGALATIYATEHPAAAVVTVDAPMRLEPFAQLLSALRPQLAGDGFAEAWAIFQDSWHMELLPAEARALLRAGDRRGDDAMRELVLSYQADLLERPLEEVLRERDTRLRRLRASDTPYLTLHSCPIDPSDRGWLHERLPRAEILVWPVGHDFPHLTQPARVADLLTGLAAGRRATRRTNDNHDESEQT
jgi:pimeloyl-ACP methyl ester carboxylesterase